MTCDHQWVHVTATTTDAPVPHLMCTRCGGRASSKCAFTVHRKQPRTGNHPLEVTPISHATCDVHGERCEGGVPKWNLCKRGWFDLIQGELDRM